MLTPTPDTRRDGEARRVMRPNKYSIGHSRYHFEQRSCGSEPFCRLAEDDDVEAESFKQASDTAPAPPEEQPKRVMRGFCPESSLFGGTEGVPHFYCDTCPMRPICLDITDTDEAKEFIRVKYTTIAPRAEREMR